MWTSTRTAAAALDDADDLVDLRAQYDLPPGVLRLDGDSGGIQPNTTPARLRQFIEHRWDRGSLRTVRRGLGEDWRREAESTAAELAPLIGVDAAEITIGESTSMNLFKALLAATRLRPDRRVLAVGHDCFASDHYLARSAADFTGCELRLLKNSGDLEDAFRAGAAVVAVSHTDVLTGEARDPVALNEMTHRHGALTLWDLSNSAGALRVDLHGWNADFAIGCGYKYLGGGSGAPGYTYIAERHRAELRTRADNRFGVGPLDVLGGFGGTPSALSMTALRAGLSILNGVSTDALENKATGLVDLFVRRLREQEAPEGLEIVEPSCGGGRGGHVCLRHRHAQYIAHGLFSRGVVADFLEPDLLRFSFSPGWLRYVDAWEAAELVLEVLDELSFRP